MIKKLTLLLSLLLLVVGALPAGAQSQEVTGTVVDETGAPVAGAYVLVKGETRGALTDADGRFTIKVKPSDTLTASFLGYDDLSIPVGAQTDLTFKLSPQANQLEEVVKVAYGAQRKASVIGSITTVDAQQLQAPMGTLSTGLAGKLAGVVAVQHTGEPGSSAEFWIRGVNTDRKSVV